MFAPIPVSVAVVLVLLAVHAQAQCTPEVHYWVEEGQLLSSSLQSPPNVLTFHSMNRTTGNAYQSAAFTGTCAGAVSFVIVKKPSHYTPSPDGFVPKVYEFLSEFDSTTGAFKYINLPDPMANDPIVWNGYDWFSFNVKCDNTVVCLNSVARINVVYTSASSHNAVPTDWNDGYDNTFNSYLKCSGTCPAGWLTSHTLPHNWDTQYFKDGTPVAHNTVGTYGTSNTQKPVDGIDFEWAVNYIVLTSYGRIGNMAARFPTFDHFEWKPKQQFVPGDFVTSKVHAKATGFDQQCLDNQGLTGEGFDVFSLDTNEATGKYASGQSWYQKFGGKHRNCDTFDNNACLYAPLLSPRTTQTEAEAIWKLEVKGCDLIWKAKITWLAIQKQVRGNGNSVWLTENVGGVFMMTGVFYNEAVQPNSWVEVDRGYMQIDHKYELKIGLSEDTDFYFELGVDVFSVDVEWFRYFTTEGDDAIGYNLMVYPARLDPLQQSFPDRRIIGFKYREVRWSEPSLSTCDTCTGAVVCLEHEGGNPGDAPLEPIKYTQDDFPHPPQCLESAKPLVFLFKGPETTTADCPLTSTTDRDNLVIFGTRGISPPKVGNSPCKEGVFQNITFRGYAPNSNKRADKTFFGFDGNMTIQFLLANGEHPHFYLDPAIYVKTLSVDGSFGGQSFTCRGSPYWPVPDMIGTSLPDKKYEGEELTNPEPGYLCEELNAKTFGPTDWAIMIFDILDVDPELVNAKRLYISIDTAPSNIYFIYRDDDLKDVSVPPEDGVHYTPDYKYFHFRNLKEIPDNTNPSLNKMQTLHNNAPPGVNPPANMDFGFAWTPGAYNEPVKIKVYCTLKILTTKNRRFRSLEKKDGESTIEERLHIQPKLTEQVRTHSTAAAGRMQYAAGQRVTVQSSSHNMVLALGIACGFLLVVVAVGALLMMRLRWKLLAPQRSHSNVAFAKEASVSNDVVQA